MYYNLYDGVTHPRGPPSPQSGCIFLVFQCIGVGFFTFFPLLSLLDLSLLVTNINHLKLIWVGEPLCGPSVFYIMMRLVSRQ
jgi:hypothetical protein